MNSLTIPKNLSLINSLQTAIINSGEADGFPSRIVKMRISRESILLVCIGVLDLISTLVWVNTHGAEEANPIFRHYLELGPIWFALMKVIMLVAPIYLLEWAKSRSPKFTRFASRFAVGAYLVMYVAGVAKLNPQLFQPKPERMALALYSSIDVGTTESQDISSIRDFKAGTDQPYNDPPTVTEGLR